MMSMTTDEVRDMALQLSPESRASLAKALIESLEPEEVVAGVEAAWLEEIESRADEVERGETAVHDWKESLDRVRQKLDEGRQQ